MFFAFVAGYDGNFAASFSQATLLVVWCLLALANSCDQSQCSNCPLEDCKRYIGDCDSVDLYVNDVACSRFVATHACSRGHCHS